jgi:hypothetical protein
MSLYADETDGHLGETGQTVVYVFPKGTAYTLRNKTKLFDQLDLAANEQPTLLEAPTVNVEAIVNRLVQQGQLTKAQVQVGQYDHESTGMTLLEALVTRGWLSQEQADDLWDELS